MVPKPPLLTELHDGRRKFLALVGELRPDLHRYCARMTGSAVDGEDVVQAALARAYFQLGGLHELPSMRAWLFRIAHHCAIDFLRARDARRGELLDEETAAPASPAEEPLLRDEAVRLALSRFMRLSTAQRCCVILKDVLGDTLEEISNLSGMSVAAVKSALHRGRAALRASVASHRSEPSAFAPPSPLLERYSTLFNTRDWQGVRTLLAESVRVELVSRGVREGRATIDSYFTHYSALEGWRFAPARLDGREVLAVFEAGAAAATHVVELSFGSGQIVAVRDFRYVPYLLRDPAIVVST